MDELQTVNQVCERLHVARSTLSEWRRRGAFPEAVRLPGGKRVAWPASVVDAWITAVSEGAVSKQSAVSRKE